MNRSRDRLRDLAAHTVTILGQGHYQSPSGSIVDIAADIAACVAGTRMYGPDQSAHPTTPAQHEPLIEVTGETTLAAAQRLGGDVAALVFASARNPGGGFLSGAQAQEESIARSSALYPSLQQVPQFYTHHRNDPDLRYSDRIIYSPAVPVFRDDHGRLLDQPYPVTFLTAAAPNLGAINTNQPNRAASVPEVLRDRATRVLQIAAAYGHRRLVLGAWGCGVFRNDPTTVAEAFAHALRQNPHFDHVMFAIYDTVNGSPAYTAFRQTFDSVDPDPARRLE